MLEWIDPPEPKPSRVEALADELAKNPMRWARIAKDSTTLFGTWWMPLTRSPSYEVKSIRTGPGAFGPRDVYARYIKPGRSTI